MEIHRSGGVSGPNRMEPNSVPVQGGTEAGPSVGLGDRVEISEHARWLEKLAQVPAVRTEKIQELRRQIEAGEFETPERIAVAVERLLEELG
ncbi:MAG: flagellar biosynthesis anti-sigma factor FlgM [Planctomycetota bacterium]